MVQVVVALRVDVCTRQGLRAGVPRLLEALRAQGLRAMFFVTMGPDRAGLALLRAWRPTFLAKLWRTRAWRLYGLRTLAAGTLLPPRPAGAGAPDLLRQIAVEGHEVAPHGWDHAGWQQGAHRRPAAGLRADLARALAACEAALGARPAASAAPGWRTTPAALGVQDDLGLAWASDARGRAPFRPLVGGVPLRTAQVPTTLPTLDELLGRVPDPAGALLAALRPGLNVLTVHAEVEGGPAGADLFRAFVAGARRQGAALVSLGEAARQVLARADELPLAPLARGHVAGRSGWVAVPEVPVATPAAVC